MREVTLIATLSPRWRSVAQFIQLFPVDFRKNAIRQSLNFVTGDRAFFRDAKFQLSCHYAEYEKSIFISMRIELNVFDL